ncbi:MAG: D-alanine--D-alanine ligase family protein [Patescibacteria group bacterium]
MKVIVLHGGVSTEREVSLNSGQNVADALAKLGHEVLLVDVIKPLEFKLNDKKIDLTDLKNINSDICFNALHGKYGEDGQIQSLLEMMELKYTGSGVLASALGMDKSKCYEIVDKYDIDIPKTYEVSSVKELKYLDLPYPLFVKPNDGGSSIATGKAEDESQLYELIQEGLKTSTKILIQEVIVGDEYTCPVLGTGGHAVALPVGIIKTNNTFFDYEAKYKSNTTIETFPAPLDEKQTKFIQDVSLEVHRILGCRGISRSDFIITKDRIVFLEINTSPGMTQTSLCPKSAEAFGLTFGQLLNKIINDV